MSKTREENVNDLINRCLVELNIASREKYDSDNAEKTAALFLMAGMELSSFIEQVELNAKLGKNEIERVESDRYFAIKSENTSGKITEVALQKYVSKDEAVREAKKASAEAEATLKKYNYLINTLNNGHIFFRGLAKKNNSWE